MYQACGGLCSRTLTSGRVQVQDWRCAFVREGGGGHRPRDFVIKVLSENQ